MTNFNEQTTHFFIKNISLTCYSRKGWCWLCVRDELETGTGCYIDPGVLLLILAGLLNRGSLRAQIPLSAVGSQFGILSPTDCFSKYPNSQPIASAHDVIHTPLPFPIWGLLWQLWLPYPLRTWVFLFTGLSVEVRPSSTLRMVPSILKGIHPRYLSFWWDYSDGDNIIIIIIVIGFLV